MDQFDLTKQPYKDAISNLYNLGRNICATEVEKGILLEAMFNAEQNTFPKGKETIIAMLSILYGKMVYGNIPLNKVNKLKASLRLL